MAVPNALTAAAIRDPDGVSFVSLGSTPTQAPHICTVLVSGEDGTKVLVGVKQLRMTAVKSPAVSGSTGLGEGHCQIFGICTCFTPLLPVLLCGVAVVCAIFPGAEDGRLAFLGRRLCGVG